MHTIDFLQNKIKDAVLSLKFERQPIELYEPIKFALSQGGKRIRPLLTLMACDMFEGDIDKALYPAIGLEIFHNFTLLHDDIMDQSPIRRGRETVYKKWNANIALLSGDTMFAIAFEYLIKTNPDYLTDILHVFNQTAIEVCEGQQYDMNFESATIVSIGDYMEMIRLKTAVLIAACLKIGALIAKTTSENIHHIHQFGLNLGIAFQLQDDLLDVFSDVDKFGKRTGNDIATNKKTYLFLKALELANEKQQKSLIRYFSQTVTDESEKIIKVTEIYKQLGIKAIAENEMAIYYRKAISCLDAIDVEKTKKQAFINYAESLMQRES